jgi:hypothetical protein
LRGVASQPYGSSLSNSYGEAVNDIAYGLVGARVLALWLDVARVAEGQTTEGILALYPDLEADDVREALLFAAEAVRERALPLAAGE